MNIWMMIAIAAMVAIALMFYIVVIEGLKGNKNRAIKEKEERISAGKEAAKRAIEKDELYKKIFELQNMNIEIEKKVYKKKEYTPEEKRAYGIKQGEFRKSLIAKGQAYEAFIAEHYQELGYDVIEHGKEKGKRDGGIDLIAKKDNEVIFIQCKNWRAGGKFVVNHTKVKEFIGNVTAFLEKNADYKEYVVKMIFAISEKVLDNSALKFIGTNKQIIRYLHLPMKDSNPEG